MLDILFIHANGAPVIYQDLHKEHSAIETPIWVAMLTQACRVKGYDVALLDCEAERLTTDQSVEEIINHEAKIYCFVVYGQNPNASSQNMEGNIATASLLKERYPEVRTLFVGAHVAALPKETLSEPGVDMVCQNEGVYTIINLLKIDVNDDSELKMVKGLGFKTKDKHIVINPPERIVPKELLEVDLPGMAWDLLPMKKYRTSHWHAWSYNTETTPFASVYTSLGCKYRCSFCMINIINRTDSADHITAADSNVFRYWEPEFIISQFDEIAKRGIKNVKIADELFVYSPKHFIRVCDLIIERGYDFNIWCYSRIDTCRPEYLDKLYKAGVRWLGLGVENPNQTLRQEIHKGGFKEVKINDLFQMMRDHGINIGANYIYGLPMDTMDSMKYTRDFMMENLTENMNLYVAMALPGSPLHYEAKQKGLTLPDRYAGYSQHSWHTHGLSTDHLTSEEILRFRDETWMAYFTNPSYLSMMNNKFGQKCVDSIKDMTKIKLKRKLLGDPLPK